MTNDEIKALCGKLAELIINTTVDGHKQFYYVTKVEQLIKKLEKENSNDKSRDCQQFKALEH